MRRCGSASGRDVCFGRSESAVRVGVWEFWCRRASGRCITQAGSRGRRRGVDRIGQEQEGRARVSITASRPKQSVPFRAKNHRLHAESAICDLSENTFLQLAPTCRIERGHRCMLGCSWAAESSTGEGVFWARRRTDWVMFVRSQVHQPGAVHCPPPLAQSLSLSPVLRPSSQLTPPFGTLCVV